MKKLLIFLSVFSSFIIRAQVSVDWVNNFYSGAGVYNGSSIVNDNKNRVYSVGDNGGNAYLMRFNEITGARKWYDSLVNTTAIKLKCDKFGFIYFIGVFHNSTSTTDNSDFIIAKYDSLGTKLWQNIYNDSLDFGDYPIDLEIDNLGNVFLVGNTENNSNQFAFRNNITLLKYSSSGTVIWKRFYGNASNNSEFAYDLVVDNNENSYLAGSTTQISGNPDFLVQKFDINGIPTWSYTLNNNTSSGSHIDVAHKITINNQNEIIVSGIVENPLNGTTGISYTAKFDLIGTKIWEKKIYNGNCKVVKHLHVDNNDNIFIAVNADSVSLYGHIVCKINNQGIVKKITASDNLGTSSSFNDYNILGAFSDKYSNLYVTGYNGQQVLRDCYIIKYDSLGQKKWKYFYSSQGSNGQEEGHAICVDSLQNIYVTGYNELSGQSFERMLNLKLCQIKDFCGLTGSSLYPTAFNAKSVASIKFNNDNYYDLVYCDSLNKTLNIYLGASNNSFSYYSSLSYTWTPTDIINADMNNDGYQDLILHNLTDDKIGIIFCYGNSILSMPVFYSSASDISKILVMDFNNDSKIDIFTLSGTQNNFSILLNAGNNAFNSPLNTSNNSSFNLVALGDINGDSYTDIVTSSSGTTNLIYKYINSGATTTFNSSFVTSSGFYRMKILLNKFDRDNFLDIAEVTPNGNAKFYKGDGAGNFTNGITPLGISTTITDVISSDFNNDSLSDLLFADKNTNTLKMYLSNLCTNTMQPYATYSLNMNSGKLTGLNMGSFNSVVNTLSTGTLVSIWNNNCPIYSSTSLATSSNTEGVNILSKESFSVYPNPFTDEITCLFHKNNEEFDFLEVFNIVGEVRSKYYINKNRQLNFSTANYSAGVYFIRLVSKNRTFTQKIVKVN